MCIFACLFHDQTNSSCFQNQPSPFHTTLNKYTYVINSHINQKFHVSEKSKTTGQSAGRFTFGPVEYFRPPEYVIPWSLHTVKLIDTIWILSLFTHLPGPKRYDSVISMTGKHCSGYVKSTLTMRVTSMNMESTPPDGRFRTTSWLTWSPYL